jgi:hypothetical protein
MFSNSKMNANKQEETNPLMKKDPATKKKNGKNKKGKHMEQHLPLPQPAPTSSAAVSSWFGAYSDALAVDSTEINSKRDSSMTRIARFVAVACVGVACVVLSVYIVRTAFDGSTLSASSTTSARPVVLPIVDKNHICSQEKNKNSSSSSLQLLQDAATGKFKNTVTLVPDQMYKVRFNVDTYPFEGLESYNAWHWALSFVVAEADTDKLTCAHSQFFLCL